MVSRIEHVSEYSDKEDSRFLNSKAVSEFIELVLKAKRMLRVVEHGIIRIVYDSNDEEALGMTCCSICKSCFVYKKLVNGQKRSKMAVGF